jgi:hypothetical protein
MSRDMRLTRRTILQGIGLGAAMGLPFLRSAPSAAAPAGTPKRFVVFFSGNEPMGKQYWQMNDLGPGNTLPSTLPEMLSSLQPHRQKLNLITDLRLVTRDVDPHHGGHTGIGHTLTGRINSPFPNATSEGHYWAGGISLDQYLADKLGVEALTLGALPGKASTGSARISSRGKDQPVHPIEDPRKAFDKLFASVNLAPDEAEKLRQQKQSVLDFVAKDLDRVKLKLPTEDRAKLDVHLEHIRSIEAQLGAPGAGAGCNPTDPTYPGGYDHEANEFFPKTARLQMDILAEALACGLTHVGSVQLGSSGSSHITPLWPDEGLNIGTNYHTLAHEWTPTNMFKQRMDVEKFHVKLFAYLLDRLDSMPEGTGTVLDNSVVLYAKPIGSQKHGQYPMFYMLAGGAGGALKTNRYLSFDKQPHNNLLTSICNLMGFDDEKFGDPSICTGALAL